MGMSSASSSETTAPRQWHTTVERKGLRADACLSELSGLSKSKVKEVMSKGAAWITRGRRTQRLRRASRLLSPGDELHLYVNPSVLAATVTTPTLIADRGGYSVWDKPAGMLSSNRDFSSRCLALGATFVAVGSDVGLLVNSARQLRDSYNDN